MNLPVTIVYNILSHINMQTHKSIINQIKTTGQINMLSIRQPFAGMMVHGKLETRTRRTNYRGWVLFQSTLNWFDAQQLNEICHPHQIKQMEQLNPMAVAIQQRGIALAIGKLIDCRPMSIDDEKLAFIKYNPNLYVYVYESVMPVKPFALKGSQSMFALPAKYIQLIQPLQ